MKGFFYDRTELSRFGDGFLWKASQILHPHMVYRDLWLRSCSSAAAAAAFHCHKLYTGSSFIKHWCVYNRSWWLPTLLKHFFHVLHLNMDNFLMWVLSNPWYFSDMSNASLLKKWLWEEDESQFTFPDQNEFLCPKNRLAASFTAGFTFELVFQMTRGVQMDLHLLVKNVGCLLQVCICSHVRDCFCSVELLSSKFV